MATDRREVTEDVSAIVTAIHHEPDNRDLILQILGLIVADPKRAVQAILALGDVAVDTIRAHAIEHGLDPDAELRKQILAWQEGALD